MAAAVRLFFRGGFFLLLIVGIGVLTGRLLRRRQGQQTWPPRRYAPTTLQAALDHPSWQVRLEAVQSLAAQHDPAQLRHLLAALDDEDPDVRETALDGLIDCGPAAIPGLLELLREGALDAREAAVRGLIALRDPAAIGGLAAALEHDSSAWVRIPAAQGLGQLGGQMAVAALARALQDKHPDVAQAARTSLRQIGTPDALAALGEAEE